LSLKFFSWWWFWLSTCQCFMNFRFIWCWIHYLFRFSCIRWKIISCICKWEIICDIWYNWNLSIFRFINIYCWYRFLKSVLVIIISCECWILNWLSVLTNSSINLIDNCVFRIKTCLSVNSDWIWFDLNENSLIFEWMIVRERWSNVIDWEITLDNCSSIWWDLKNNLCKIFD
jgi:hypothetical protein